MTRKKKRKKKISLMIRIGINKEEEKLIS